MSLREGTVMLLRRVASDKRLKDLGADGHVHVPGDLQGIQSQPRTMAETEGEPGLGQSPLYDI